MTKLIIDLSDALDEFHPDDKVVVWSPVHREGARGQVVNTRPKRIPLSSGKAEAEVEPGPLMVKVQCMGLSDTQEKEVVVPDQSSVTLWDLLEIDFTYDPPVISEVQEARAEVREAVARVGSAEQVGEWAERSETAASDALTIKNSIPATVQSEVDTRVPPKVAEVIASDTAVTDAAAAAVDAVAEDIKYVKDPLAPGTDLDTLDIPGHRNSEDRETTTSLLNLPTDIQPEPFDLEVKKLSERNGVFLQIITQKIFGEGGTYVWERVAHRKSWFDWIRKSVIDLTDRVEDLESQVGQQTILAGENLNDLTRTGDYNSEERAVTRTLISLPGWAEPEPFYLRVESLSDVNRVRRQIFTQKVVGEHTTRTAERVSHGNTWYPWVDHADTDVWRLDASRIVWWGDSAVQGHNFGAELSLPSQLGLHVTDRVVNNGRNGHTANATLVRAGVIQLWAYPEGGTIPGSGSVTVAVTGPDLRLQGNTDIYQVMIAGVEGTLSQVSEDEWRFTRAVSGSGISLTGPALVYAEPIRAADTHVVMTGGNDWIWDDLGPDPDRVTHVVSAYQRFVDAIPDNGGERRVLVAGAKTRRDTQPGDDTDQEVREVNRQLQALYPASFVPRQDWLVNRSLAAVGITPTAEDQSAMAAGIVPPSAFADQTHIKTEVVAAEARELWAPALVSRGWATPVEGETLPGPWVHDTTMGQPASRTELDDRVPASLGLHLDTTVGTRLMAGGTMIYGDTGWRDVTSLIPVEVVSGKLLLARRDTTVWLSFDELQLVDDGSSVQTWHNFLPAGYHQDTPDFYHMPLPARTSAYAAGPVRVSRYGQLVIYGLSGQKIMSGTVSFPVPGSWPAARPGSPF